MVLALAKKNSNSVYRTNKSFILTLATLAILGYFVISLVSASAQAENDELKELAREEDEKTYMERIARDVLGYVLPGESVYYDVSTAN